MREQNASSIALNQLARCSTAHFPDYRKNQVKLLTLVVFAIPQRMELYVLHLAALGPEERIRLALEAAAHFVVTVNPPFTVIQSD